MRLEMRNEISVLMDGELFEDDAGSVLDKTRPGSGEHRDWALYHLIGDVLRQPEHIPFDLSAVVREHMQDEPVVLAPRVYGVGRKVRAVALSAAASLVAVGMVAWMSLQISPETVPKVAMQQGATRLASLKNQLQSNDYLLAHQEFSPSTDMNGGASYIRSVAYRVESK